MTYDEFDTLASNCQKKLQKHFENKTRRYHRQLIKSFPKRLKMTDFMPSQEMEKITLLLQPHDCRVKFSPNKIGFRRLQNGWRLWTIEYNRVTIDVIFT